MTNINFNVGHSCDEQLTDVFLHHPVCYRKSMRGIVLLSNQNPTYGLGFLPQMWVGEKGRQLVAYPLPPHTALFVFDHHA